MKACLAAALLSSLLSNIHAKAIKRGDNDWDSPVYDQIFQNPLPIPSNAQPVTSYTHTPTGEVFDFYEVKIQAFTKQIYPNRQATNLEGYNGQSPGPTFRVTKGRRTVVRVVNEVESPASVHLHGSASRPVFDGFAEDLITTGEYKDYVWPNDAPRTMWYHDHAVHITAENVFKGQAGFYIVEDPALEATLGLPQGDYDIPLIIQDKKYLTSGQTLTPATEDDSYYGDVIHVNGAPWPYLNVQPRKYRLRLLDGSTSRSYKLSIQSSAGTKVPMVVVASDAGYMEAPVSTNDLIISPAERYEVIVDFSSYANQTLTMRNPRDFSSNEDFARTDRVMQFRVGTTVASTAGNGAIPSTLVDLNFPTDTVIDHRFSFGRTNSEWRINDVGFADVNNRTLAKPAVGSTEIWELENSSGGWSHPIHIHLIDFKVLTRSGNGRGVMPYESGFKDVVFLDEGETATVIARFHPWAGQYMFHCHNSVHEDQDMMAVFDVGNTKVYPMQGDQFSDPLNPTFRAQDYPGAMSASEAQSTVLPYYANMNIYT